MKVANIIDEETKERSEKDIPDDPCKAHCPSCIKDITTYIRSQYNPIVWIISILFLYVYGLLYSIILLVLTVPLCKDLLHSCPECLTILFKKNFYPIKYKEGYFSLHYDKCIIIIRQFYVLLLLSVVLCFGVYLNIIYYTSKQARNASVFAFNNEDTVASIVNTHSEHSDPNNISWETLIHDCGAAKIIENSALANEIFERKYFKKVVHWQGHFMFGVVNHFNPLDFNPDHLVNIYVRMLPSESIKNPDLFLYI